MIAKYMNEGEKARLAEDWDKAHSAYVAVLEIDAGNVEAEKYRKLASFEKPQKATYLEAVELYENKKYREAIAKVQLIHPDSIYTRRVAEEKLVDNCQLGVVAEGEKHLKGRKKNWEQALRVAEEVLAMKPKPSQNVLRKAENLKDNALDEKKRQEEAIAAKEKEKNDKDGKDGRDGKDGKDGDKDDKEEKLTKEKRKELAEQTFKDKCIPAVKSRDNDRIIRDCKAVLEYDKYYYQALIQIANAYEKKKDKKNALKYFKKALKVAPKQMKANIQKKIDVLEGG